MKFSLTPEDLEALKTLHRNVSGLDYIKVTSILMLHLGISAQNVSVLLGIYLSTIYRYLSLYQQGGISVFHGVVDLLNRIGFTYKKTKLNLIERLWKFLIKNVINTGLYRTKEIFRKAIRYFFDNIETFKQELESLITLNFSLANSQSISF